MGETVESILEQLRDGLIGINTAEERIDAVYRDEQLRDSFAMVICPAVVQTQEYSEPEEIARMSYKLADAMMKARRKSA